jgi:hypothetical protein
MIFGAQTTQNAGAKMQQPPTYGQDSRRMKAGSFPMLVHSVLGCKTLGQAMDRSLRFFSRRRVVDIDSFRSQQFPDRAGVCGGLS